MKCCCAVVLVLVLLVAVSCTEDAEVNTTVEDVRETRKMSNEGWKAVETISEGTSGWIPRDDTNPVPPRRRRLRKRKRKPPADVREGDSENAQSESRVSFNKMPPSMPAPWDEITEEPMKPSVRRRIAPSFHTSEDAITVMPSNTDTLQFIRQDNNKTELKDKFLEKRIDETTKQYEASPSNLRALLKQNGGLSLSEILQKNNLSLSELLSGNQKAISALTEKPRTTTISSFSSSSASDNPKQMSKYQRLPPSMALKKLSNRNYEQEGESRETISSKETLEAQRKRLALLQKHNPNKMFLETTKYEVITEPITEKRIFVPSHPKLYTSLDYKPDIEILMDQKVSNGEETVTPSPNTKQPELKLSSRLDPRSKLKSRLPLTSAKMNKLLKMTRPINFEYTTIPPKAIKIDINELFGLKSIDKTKKEDDEPLRMTIDLESLFEKKTERSEAETYTTTSTTLKPTTQMTKEKLNESTAKEEINEILKDPKSREHLARVLRDRNMTVQELIEQRERGSSQLHLADIFHNKTKEPEPNDEAFVGSMNVEFFPKSNRQPKGLINTTENTKMVTSKEVSVTSFPTFKIEISKENDNRNQSFPWGSLYPDLFKTLHQDSNKEDDLITMVVTEPFLENDLQRVEDLENNISLASHEKLNVDEDVLQEEAFFNLPSVVKSAIWASLAIISLSLIVFVTILVIFRWTQKQRTKLNYCSSTLSSRFNPILENSQKNFRTFVTETLGRKKHYYKNHLKSMTDSIWDSRREPSF